MAKALYADRLTDDRHSWEIKWRSVGSVQSDHERKNRVDESLHYIDDYLSRCSDRISVAVDVGCGNSRHVARYESKISGRFVGLDFSLRGLRTMRSLGHYDALVADATRIPMGDSLADFVLMSGVVYELEDHKAHRAIFSEIFRIMKPGAVCLFVNNSNLHLLDRLYLNMPIRNRLVRRRARKREIAPDSYKFWYYRFVDADVQSLAKAAGLGVDGPYLCNRRSGLGRTWDRILVTPESCEKNIAFRNNMWCRVIGNTLLAIGRTYPKFSACTAVYQLIKGQK